MSFYDIIQALLRWLKNSSAFSAKMAQLYNSVYIRSFGVMKKETMNAMLQNIEKSLTDGDQISFTFQGGEPTLAGLNYFRRFVDVIKL